MPNNIQKVIEEGLQMDELIFDTAWDLAARESVADYPVINAIGTSAFEEKTKQLKDHIRTTISTVLQAIEEEAGRVTLIEAAFPTSKFTVDWKQGHNVGVSKVIALLKSARDSVK